MTVVNGNSTVSATSSAATELVASESPFVADDRKLRRRDKSPQRLAFQRTGTLLSPTAALAWLLGALGVVAAIAPWLTRGWLWLDLIVAGVVLLACYDGIALWLARIEFVPVILSPENGLRGREGQSVKLPLAFSGPVGRRLKGDLRVAIMPATRESEVAIRAKSEMECLRLEQPEAAELTRHANLSVAHLWPWTPEITLLRRGRWPLPRIGTERRSRFGIWRLREWFNSSESFRIDADLRSGRRKMLMSPVYRALVASRETPWTGQGRDFERLREYQPGDNYAEIAWKTTARRGAPVTRLFQWEQKQEVYFLVDQSRASAQPVDPTPESENSVGQTHTPRRQLDLAVETALVGATIALELGDEFGLVTYADEPKSWLRAGSGQFQFHQLRDRLLSLEPLPTTADYETLFSSIRLRLRRRAYLVLLADLAERSISKSMLRGIPLLRSSHVILMTSVLPAHAQPAFSPGEKPRTDDDVYAALAGEKENQRLGALSRQVRRFGAELRFVHPESFLRTALEAYLESKREQRV